MSLCAFVLGEAREDARVCSGAPLGPCGLHLFFYRIVSMVGVTKRIEGWWELGVRVQGKVFSMGWPGSPERFGEVVP